MEDYEKTNAREWDLDGDERPKQAVSTSNWQVVGNSRQPESRPQRSSPQEWKATQGAVQTKKPKRPPSNLATDTDNEGLQAWRTHEDPREVIRIPDELVLQDKSHTEIARHHRAFVFTESRKGIAGSMTFGIWGGPQAVASTKEAINEWISDFRSSRKSEKSSKFAKVVSLTPVLRERAEKAWKKEVKKAKFRQYPPPHQPFGAIGSFHWPVQEYRPDEILGTNYEALDPIRMDCSCYVLFVKDRSIFQVMGKGGDVQKGLLRLRGTCFQIAARQITPLRSYLLHWPNVSHLPGHVRLESYEHTKLITDDATAEPKIG